MTDEGFVRYMDTPRIQEFLAECAAGTPVQRALGEDYAKLLNIMDDFLEGREVHGWHSSAWEKYMTDEVPKMYVSFASTNFGGNFFLNMIHDVFMAGYTMAERGGFKNKCQCQNEPEDFDPADLMGESE